MANFRIIGGGEVSAHINDPNVLLISDIIIEPTMATGVTNYVNNGNKLTYYYKVGTRVFVSVGCNIASGIMTNQLAFTLPVGYRPKRRIFAVGRAYNSAIAYATIVVGTDGAVKITSSDMGILGYVEFDAMQ